jgi:hypothetical protein
MDPIEKIISIAKEDQKLTGVISETVRILRGTLSKVKDKKSFDNLIILLKKMARKIREECPLAFPVFNIITQILSKLCSEESDEDQQKPRLLKLLSNIEEVPVDDTKSRS